MDKMKIFISWSGPRSGAVAELLKEYLPVINNAFDPWLSSVDIDKGSRSTAEIANALASAKAGIICLTPNNLTEPWLLYEAGGIAKTVDKPLACTLLIGLKPSDVSPPLGDFQHTTRLTEKELLNLVKTLNKALGDGAREDAHIEKTFRLCWPELEQKFEKLPPDGAANKAQRTAEDLLAEILDTVRGTNQENTRRLQFTLDGIESVFQKLAVIETRLPIGIIQSVPNLWDSQMGTSIPAVGNRPTMHNVIKVPGSTFHTVPTYEEQPTPTPADTEALLKEAGVTRPRRKFAHASGKRRSQTTMKKSPQT